MDENKLEAMDKADMVKDFLTGCPHIFCIEDGDKISCSISGIGGDVLKLWARLTTEMCKVMEFESLDDLVEVALMAAIQSIADKHKEKE